MPVLSSSSSAPEEPAGVPGREGPFLAPHGRFLGKQLCSVTLSTRRDFQLSRCLRVLADIPS